MLGNKGNGKDEFALQLTSMEVENTSLFIHVWCVVRLGGIFCGGRVRGGGLLRGLPSFLSPPFFTLISSFLGFCAFLDFLPILFGYDPFRVNTEDIRKLIPRLSGHI